MKPDRHCLYLMMTVTGREHLSDFVTLYREKETEVHEIALGHGTANEQTLRLLALDETEKAFVFSVVIGSCRFATTTIRKSSMVTLAMLRPSTRKTAP